MKDKFNIELSLKSQNIIIFNISNSVVSSYIHTEKFNTLHISQVKAFVGQKYSK